jgi:hypothetical protein
MKIACLAWGSLLWKTEPLALSTPWYTDGPSLPLEFCRVGDGGELATALCPDAPEQASWWALLQTEWIGTVPSEGAYPFSATIRRWMDAKGLDAVVWTALPPRHANKEGQAPDAAQAVEYLDSLVGEKRAHAEDYIRSVPARFDSPTRRMIIRELGWEAEEAEEDGAALSLSTD